MTKNNYFKMIESSEYKRVSTRISKALDLLNRAKDLEFKRLLKDYVQLSEERTNIVKRNIKND